MRRLVTAREQAEMLWPWRTAGANGPLPPMTMEPFDTMWSNGVMARHADDGRPVGHLHWYGDGEIETIRVHPDFQRQGIGSAMLKHAQAHPDVYESDKPIHHSNQLTEAGRAWANSDQSWSDPGDEHVESADPDPHTWGWTAVKDYTPAHIPYTGQNEVEMKPHLNEDQPHLKVPYTAKTPYRVKTPSRVASSRHRWPKKWGGDHPDVPFDKRWGPNHPQHDPTTRPW